MVSCVLRYSARSLTVVLLTFYDNVVEICRIILLSEISRNISNCLNNARKFRPFHQTKFSLSLSQVHNYFLQEKIVHKT